MKLIHQAYQFPDKYFCEIQMFPYFVVTIFLVLRTDSWVDFLVDFFSVGRV